MPFHLGNYGLLMERLLCCGRTVKETMNRVMLLTDGEVKTNDQVEILLVDDREENLLALEAAIRSPQYRLVKATSGDSALRYLLEHKPALILLDVQMPNLDGYATAELIKGSERTREIPIIFLTALNKEEMYVHKGYETGAVDYISKPLDIHILRSKVKVFADLYRKNQQLIRAERDLRIAESRERERQLAELELRSLRREQIAQKKYQELVQGIHHGIVWSARPEGMVFSYVGPTAEKLLGYSSSQWFGEENFWRNHIHPEDREKFENAVKRALDERSGVEVEHRFLSFDGKTVWLHTGMRVANAAIESSKLLELRGLSVDITAVKAADIRVSNGKRRSDLLADASLKLAESFDVDNSLKELCKMMVPGFVDWFCLDVMTDNGLRNACLSSISSDSSEQLNSDFTRYTPDLNSDNVYKYMYDTGKSISYPEISPKTLSRIAGCPRRVAHMSHVKSVIMVPIGIRGRCLGMMTIGSSEPDFFDSDDLNFAIDLAWRVAAALESAKLYGQAQAAVRLRDEFLSIASHELKTPLTPLKLQIQQLLRMLSQRKDWNEERVIKLLGTSNRQISRLSKLIEDLLDISRLSRGNLQLELEDFSLPDMIEDVVQRFARQLDDTGCEVKVNLESPLEVHWDAFRIEQVIVNLLTNAMKYAPGKPIHIEAHKSGRMAVFSVRDEGIGIAPEDQLRIFERFERAVSQSHFGGLGLGLYIVSQILELHGGTIRVQSEKGKGSKFTVEIPVDGPAALHPANQAVPAS